LKKLVRLGSQVPCWSPGLSGRLYR